MTTIDVLGIGATKPFRPIRRCAPVMSGFEQVRTTAILLPVAGQMQC